MKTLIFVWLGIVGIAALVSFGVEATLRSCSVSEFNTGYWSGIAVVAIAESLREYMFKK